MNATQQVPVRKWLYPFSWIYGFIVWFRGKLFDWNVLKSQEFDIPVICVGNITAGGTGKTPHVEYLVNLLKTNHNVAVLSRGYKRKTKGFLLATEQSTCLEIGDEPFQIKRKFPDVTVAVDADRRRGISNLLASDNPPQVVILDDAFQNRYVIPSYTIILSNYNRPIYEDALLPAGLLRESARNTRKASMVVVSKCATDLRPIDYRVISHDLNILPCQDLLFSYFEYKKIKSVFSSDDLELDLDFLKDKTILLVTGIASNQMIVDKLKTYTEKIEQIPFKDHYVFKKKDIKKIRKRFDSIESDNKIILVTEKDVSRLLLRETDMVDGLDKSFYYLPIEVAFLGPDGSKLFNEKILKHVKENSRNRVVFKKKD